MRQGKLIERDVSLFPSYDEPEEEFLSYLGQFYAKPEHIKPKEVLITEKADRELAEQLLEIKVLQPKKARNGNSC